MAPRGPSRTDARPLRLTTALAGAVMLVLSLLATAPALARDDASAGARDATGASSAADVRHDGPRDARDRARRQARHHIRHLARRCAHRHYRRHHHHRCHRLARRHHRLAQRAIEQRRHHRHHSHHQGTGTVTTTAGTTTTPVPTAPVPTDVPAGNPTGATAGTARSTLGLLAIGNDQPQHLGDVRPYRYVALQHWFGDVVDRIHAASPTTQAVAYFETAAVRDQDCSTAGYDTHVAYDSAPVNYCWVQRFHPDWFLRDSSGKPLHFADYPEYVAVDVSRPGYQQLWIDTAIRLARAGHFDGILFDDVLIGVSHGLSGRIAGWTDQQYGNAMADFASSIGDHLRAAGLLGMANAGIDPWVPWQVDAGMRMAPHVDVINREFTVRWGYCGGYSSLFTDPASQGNPPLSMIEDFQRRLQGAGAGIGSVDYADSSTATSDVATMVYGRASFLLTWDGSSPSAYFFRTCGIEDPAAAGWTADPGTPTGPTQSVGGLLVRPFSGGAVVLNGSTSAHPLPDDLTQGYVDSTGRTTSPGQSVGSRTALVLLRQ